jgi:hypothetical protein
MFNSGQKDKRGVTTMLNQGTNAKYKNKYD